MNRRAPLLRYAFVLLTALAPALARADAASVATLIRQLKTGADDRVRAQAALGLGASGDGAVVRPLCDALRDRGPTVRTAVAAALGKLRDPDAVPCLEAAKAKETTPAVKGQIEQSLVLLAATGAAGAPPPAGSETKYYVALEIKNNTSRSADEIEALIREAMQNKILEHKAFAVAPRGETPIQGAKIVKAKRLKGFLLVVTVEPPVYAKDKLSQPFRVSVWSYPDKSLKRDYPTGASTPAAKPDRAAEDILLNACVEDSVTAFVKMAPTL